MSISELLRSELAALVARHSIEVERIKADHGDALSPGLSDALDGCGVAALDVIVESRRLELGITTGAEGEQ